MDKSIKWQSPPQSESESPTLSDKPSVIIKRKRSSIFGKLRKSILSITSSSGDNEQGESKDKIGLKRALSMDAGLQDRITELASEEVQPVEIQRVASGRVRRSKSLMASTSELNHMAVVNSGIGSNATSPKAFYNNDSILESCEDTRTAVSLINTIESSHLHLSHHVFNCSWLPPTRKSQLFPGHLRLLQPNSSTIQFTCQHFTRTIRLKFLLDDILNISQGSWNDKRNQALIIDLIRGKRKTWVFVAWEDGQFETATDILVQAWRKHCMNHIKNRLDRRSAHLNMKYCRIIKEADQAVESGKLKLESFGILDDFLKFLKFVSGQSEPDNMIIITKRTHTPYTLKSILFAKEIEGIVPEILASILTEKSTNFMTNFRVLQGIVITNDSGWDHLGTNTRHTITTETNSRTFISFIAKDGTATTKIIKWKVSQRFILDTTDAIVFETTLLNVDIPQQAMKVIYEIETIPEILKSNRIQIKISAESTTGSDEIFSQFRNNYFPSLFQLLEALIEESRCDFDSELALETEYRVASTHFRFIKDSIRIKIIEFDLYLTTCFLPILYKLIHFREFKFIRYSILGIIILLFTRVFLFYTLNYIRTTRSTIIDVKGEFETILKDLTADTSSIEEPVHKLKLKYAR